MGEATMNNEIFDTRFDEAWLLVSALMDKQPADAKEFMQKWILIRIAKARRDEREKRDAELLKQHSEWFKDTMETPKLVLELMDYARSDERQRMAEEYPCPAECKDGWFEKGRQSRQAEIDAILLKLKENMELVGYKEGWDNPFTTTRPYRQGQFSVYEWLKREMMK